MKMVASGQEEQKVRAVGAGSGGGDGRVGSVFGLGGDLNVTDAVAGKVGDLAGETGLR